MLPVKGAKEFAQVRFPDSGKFCRLVPKTAEPLVTPGKYPESHTDTAVREVNRNE